MRGEDQLHDQNMTPFFWKSQRKKLLQIILGRGDDPRQAAPYGNKACIKSRIGYCLRLLFRKKFYGKNL
jgi:hypothetical protein